MLTAHKDVNFHSAEKHVYRHVSTN